MPSPVEYIKKINYRKASPISAATAKESDEDEKEASPIKQSNKNIQMTKESQESKDWFGGDFGNNDFGSSEPASRFKKKDPSQIKITKRGHGHTGSNKNSGSFKMTGSDPTTAPNSNNAGAFVDDTK